MDEREYRSIYELEDTHWWYVGLRSLVFESAEKSLKGKKPAASLDAGCGAGAALKSLSNRGRAAGIDYSPVSLGFCKKRGLTALAQASVTELPFKDGSFDLVISLDVIYHSGVKDDVAALKEFRRVLKDGGILILNLPAYEFLRSPHDLANFTQRRYTKAVLQDRLRLSGLSMERLTYRNTFLFPMIALVRIAKKYLFSSGKGSGSDLIRLPSIINALLLMIISIENSILKVIDLPFGSSVFCVARKK
ncbi:MAG: class I SAM-dependent methyltransferase [Deltaproteobacteria bacterium]|nr:class I SAM-dependent methyltransferase [Deltaproteobacteria bacterium]